MNNRKSLTVIVASSPEEMAFQIEELITKNLKLRIRAKILFIELSWIQQIIKGRSHRKEIDLYNNRIARLKHLHEQLTQKNKEYIFSSPSLCMN